MVLIVIKDKKVIKLKLLVILYSNKVEKVQWKRNLKHKIFNVVIYWKIKQLNLIK